MAPEPRRKIRENQYPFELGLRGRKTGIIVPDSGIRDEHGLEPTENWFSSPAKSQTSRSGRRVNGNSTLSSDEMDEGESSIPEPAAVLAIRKSGSMILPPPKGKSPVKTFLGSPARRNPSLGPVSSAVRGSIVEPRTASVSTSVRRKLDFSMTGADNLLATSPQTKKRRGIGSSTLEGPSRALGQPYEATMIVGDEDDALDQIDVEELIDEDAQDILPQEMAGFGDDEEVLPAMIGEETTEQPQIQKPKKDNSKSRRSVAEERNMANTNKKSNEQRNIASEEESQDHEGRPKKRQRTSDVLPRSKKPLGLKKQRKPQNSSLATIEETDSPQLQRGPPLPRRAGLMMVRRETPLEGNAFKQTRSGRHSFKPLAYWKNERVEYSDDEVEDRAGKFLVPRIKEVLRVDESAQKSKNSKRTKSGRNKKPLVEHEDEGPAELWETEPGRLYGDVVSWDPDDPSGAQAEEREDEIALSSAAIITREVADASFRLAKTLTLPFFGSGVVDLPPGSIKRSKNARKMQLAFFIFTGRVKVIVNGNEFRISKGGMFQVPRGNTYSIENDYESDARIFFSQGCEVFIEEVDESQA